MKIDSSLHRMFLSFLKIFFILFCVLAQMACVSTLPGFAQEAVQRGPVELNGDQVEYSVDGNQVIAKGNVVVTHSQAVLYCDEVELSRDTNIAHARGHVRLVSEEGEISGDEMTFDFETMTGDFHNAKIVADPYYGGAKKISKVGENEILMHEGYMSTSDFDKPEYRMTSKKIEVYPGDKLIARSNKFKLGSIPLVYLPKYTQSLKDTRPRFQIIPGYDKDWGAFLLTSWRQHFNDHLTGTLHLDYRERLDVGSGFDVDYKTDDFGNGIVKTYYTNERRIVSRHLWEERLAPTPERERYKIEWRHKWDVDEKTNAIMQYYKLSDDTFLKDYFESENDKEGNPPTFFVLTRGLPVGTMSFRTDARVNRFEESVERIPEVRYDLSSKELGDTGVYFKNFTTVSKLTKKFPSPTELRHHTDRIHTENELSYPMKVGFVEMKPFVGEELTYYSKAKDEEESGGVRAMKKTGVSLSTKFYRIFDLDAFLFGEPIDRLRHILTPSVSYLYSERPTISSGQLNQFDSIDSRDRADRVNVALENKLQVKRDDKTKEFLRAVVSSDYFLEKDPAGEGFEVLQTDIDLKPADWLTLYFDSDYLLETQTVSTANFDIYVNSGSRWNFGIGRRYNAEVDDQITTQFFWKLNSKWAFRLLDRFNIEDGDLEEQEYVLTRDLHSWEMDFHVNDTKGEGGEFILLFRLKAFPDIGVDFGTGFNKRESGSEGE